MKETNLNKVAKYESSIIKFGGYALLYLLEEYEKEERFEECNLIVIAINSFNRHFQYMEQLPTKFSMVQSSDIRKAFSHFGLGGFDYMQRIKQYADEIKVYVRS